MTTPSVTACASCRIPLVTGHVPATPGGHARHSGRGLCATCYKRHEKRGTLKDFPTLGDGRGGVVGTVFPGGRPIPFDAMEWADRGLCVRDQYPELWFPEQGQSPNEAKAICRRCPVIAECLAWAISNGEKYGVYGGLTGPERRAIHLRKKAS